MSNGGHISFTYPVTTSIFIDVSDHIKTNSYVCFYCFLLLDQSIFDHFDYFVFWQKPETGGFYIKEKERTKTNTNSARFLELEMEQQLWIRPDQCWTSLVAEWEQILVAKFSIWWKDWNQKSGLLSKHESSVTIIIILITSMPMESEFPGTFVEHCIILITEELVYFVL